MFSPTQVSTFEQQIQQLKRQHGEETSTLSMEGQQLNSKLQLLQMDMEDRDDLMEVSIIWD